MPCDTVQTVSVVFDKNTNPDLLFDALKTMGLNPHREGNIIHFGSGEFYNTKTCIMTTEPGRDISEIKKAMGVVAFRAMAKKYGWTLTPDPKKKNQFVMNKR